MNEQAINDAYSLFTQNGYKKSIDDFKTLISTNPQALSDAYSLFTQNGYKKSEEDFKVLMGVGATPTELKKKEPTALPSSAGQLPSQKTEEPVEFDQQLSYGPMGLMGLTPTKKRGVETWDNFSKATSANTKTFLASAATAVGEMLDIASTSPMMGVQTPGRDFGTYTRDKMRQLKGEGDEMAGASMRRFAEKQKEEASKIEYDTDTVTGFLGALVPSTAGVAASIGASYINPALGAGLGYASMATLTASSVGSGIEAYDEYKKEKGLDSDPAARLGVGILFGAAEALTEKLQLDRYLPGGVSKKAMQTLLKSIPEEVLEKEGADIVRRFASESVSNSKLIGDLVQTSSKGAISEGATEALTSVVQEASKYAYFEKDDRSNIFSKEFLGEVASSFLGGAVMGAGLGPLSFGSQRVNNNKRRKAAGQVIVGRDSQTNEAVEVVGREGEEYIVVKASGEQSKVPVSRIEGSEVSLSYDAFKNILGGSSAGTAMVSEDPDAPQAGESIAFGTGQTTVQKVDPASKTVEVKLPNGSASTMTFDEYKNIKSKSFTIESLNDGENDFDFVSREGQLASTEAFESEPEATSISALLSMRYPDIEFSVVDRRQGGPTSAPDFRIIGKTKPSTQAQQPAGAEPGGTQPVAPETVQSQPVDQGPAAEVPVETPKPQLPEKTAAKLTEDGQGNYVFHHYSAERRPFIKRSDGTGSRATSREEQRSLSAVGGLAMYYAQEGQLEGMVESRAQHTVTVPKEKVYDADADPLGFIKEARERFDKARPGQAFDDNYRVAFITQVAGDNGFDMVVAKWGGNQLRAQTTKELVPIEGNIQMKPKELEAFNVGDKVKFQGGTYTITEVDGDVLRMDGVDMYGDKQKNVANLKRDRKRLEKIEPEQPKVVKAIAAPFYNTQVTGVSDAAELRQSDGYKAHLETIRQIADVFGIKINQLEDTIGGYQNDAGEKIVELSTVITVAEDTNLDRLEEMAAVLASMAPEVQESTIAGRYVEESDPGYQGDGGIDEFVMQVGDLQGALDSLKAAEIFDFTLNETEGTVTLLDFSKGKDDAITLKLARFVQQLSNRGISYGKQERHTAESRFIDPGRRAEILGRLQKDAVDNAKDQGGTAENRLLDVVNEAIKRDNEYRESKGLPLIEDLSRPIEVKKTQPKKGKQRPKLAGDITSSVENAVKSIGISLPDIQIIVGDDTRETNSKIRGYFKSKNKPASGEKIVRSFKNARGMVLYTRSGTTNKITAEAVILDKSKSRPSTAAHESWHLLFSTAFGQNPVKFQQFQKSVSKQLVELGYSEIDSALKEFMSLYKGDAKYEEYMVELGGLLATGGIDPGIVDRSDIYFGKPKLAERDKTLLQKIKEVINRFSKELLGKEMFLEDATPENILQFMVAISDKIARGESVSGIVSREKPLKSPSTGEVSVKTESIGPRNVLTESGGLTDKEKGKQGLEEILSAKTKSFQAKLKKAKTQAAKAAREGERTAQQARLKDFMDAKQAVVEGIQALMKQKFMVGGKEVGVPPSTVGQVNRILNQILKGKSLQARYKIDPGGNRVPYISTVEEAISNVMKIIADSVRKDSIDRARANRRVAKNNVKAGKLGVLPTGGSIDQLLQIDPSIVPLSMFDQYMEIINEIGQRKKALPLEEQGILSQKVQDVLDVVDAENGLLEQLALAYDNHPKVMSKRKDPKTGQIIQYESYSKTIEDMLAKGVISTSEYQLMKRRKDSILPKTPSQGKAPMTRQEADAVVNVAFSLKSSLPSPGAGFTSFQNNVIRVFNNLTRSDIESMVREVKDDQGNVVGYNTADVANLARVMDNLSNGYITNLAQTISEKIQAAKKANKVASVISKYKNNPLNWISASKATIKNFFNGKVKGTTTINEKIRRTGNYAIDVALNNFENSDVYNEILRPISVAIERKDKELQAITAEVVRIIDSIPIKDQFEQNTLVRMIMLHKMRQSDPTMPSVKEWIEATKKGDSQYLDETMDKIQSMYDSVEDNGDFDINKAMNKLSPKGEKLLKTIDKIQKDSLSPKVAFGATVIRGSRVPVLEYYAATPRMVNGKKDVIAEEGLIKNYTQPSSRASTFHEKTKVAHEISFDAVESVLWSARHTLTDFYLTPELRTAQATVKNIKRMDWKGQQKEAADALDLILTDSIEMVLGSQFGDRSTTEKITQGLVKKAYQSMLAGFIRPGVELVSNISYALIDGASEFYQGTKILSGKTKPGIMSDAVFNLGSSQLNRMFNLKGGASRYADASRSFSYDPMRDEITGMRKFSKVASSVGDQFDTFSNTTMSAPDQIVARTVFFGALSIRFKELTGKDIDLEKVADNDQGYMEANFENLKLATEFADSRVAEGFSSASDFDGILRNKVTRSDKWYATAFKSFNGFMNKFLVSEYVTSAKAVNAMIGNGNISRVQGAKMLVAQSARMMSYSYLMTLVNGYVYNKISELILDQLGVEPPEEEEEEVYDEEGNLLDTEESYLNILARETASVVAALAIDRNFGNIAKAFTSTGVEALNKAYGDGITYKGPYDQYEDNVSFPFFEVDKKAGGLSTFEQTLLKGSGAMSPYMRNVMDMMNHSDYARMSKNEATVKKHKDAMVLSGIKMMALVTGVPLYRDFNKINQEVTYAIRQAEKNTTDTEEDE